MMKRWIVPLLTVSAVSLAWGQDKPAASAPSKSAGASGPMTDPVEILKAADAAAKAVDSVRYRCQARLEGAARGNLSAEGEVILSGGSEQGFKRFRMELGVKGPADSAVRQVTLGSDGETYWLLDAVEKRVHADIDPGVMGRSAQFVQLAGMLEFVHPTPFKDEINAKKSELLGVKKVGEVECYEVSVDYGQGDQKADWCFSTKDLLPRAVKRTFPGQDGKLITNEITLEKLEVAPKVEDKAFAVPAPEGYEKTDKPAP
jgi:outer membrane lipoprotein-sorting protein